MATILLVSWNLVTPTPRIRDVPREGGQHRDVGQLVGQLPQIGVDGLEVRRPGHSHRAIRAKRDAGAELLEHVQD